jgi:zinc D-Ala-D-Ala carboxypeptidase
MGDLTKNISRKEIECQCGCGLDTMDYETAAVWQEARDHFNAPLHINDRNHSGARCLTHNREIGSSDSSQHPRCRAIDGEIEGVTPKELYDYFDLKYPDRYGIGLYSWGVHLDTRKEKARWSTV